MNGRPLNIVFMGTPEFAVPTLKALIDSPHTIAAVYTRAPTPQGRGMQVRQSPVHQVAAAAGIRVETPASLRKSVEAQEKFAALNADLAIVAAYGLLLPRAVLEAPRFGCINVHASLLPRWRGAAPIQYAIWKGDTETGITLMQMEEGLDTGPMIARQSVPITENTTATDMHDSLAVMGAAMTLETVNTIAATGTHPDVTPQDDSLATYAPMLVKSDGLIDPAAPAIETDRQIRALNPWPGTYIDGPRGRVKILEARLDGERLIYERVQPEGRKVMDETAAKNGGYL